jgi:hypothetical protein
VLRRLVLAAFIASTGCATARTKGPGAETPIPAQPPDAATIEALIGNRPGPGAVLAASLQVDEAIAGIQEEQAALQEAIAHVQEGQNARSALLNLAAALFAAGSAVGTGLTLKPSTTTAGTWITTIASGVGAAISIGAALAGSSGRPLVPTRKSMLAPLLDRAPGVPTYPPQVWGWLQGEPRRALVSQWEKLGRIGGDEKRSWLSRPVVAEDTADVGDLQDRNRMLADVRAQVALLKRALSESLAQGTP